jgi:plastocyanin
MTKFVPDRARRGLLPALLALSLLFAGRAVAAEGAHDHMMMETAQAGAPVAANAVKIDNFSFAPAAIIVAAGTTVTWTNEDDIPHTVTQDDKKFKSPPLDTDDHWSFTFTEPGEYHYFCSLHSKMVGTVVVKP